MILCFMNAPRITSIFSIFSLSLCLRVPDASTPRSVARTDTTHTLLSKTKYNTAREVTTSSTNSCRLLRPRCCPWWSFSSPAFSLLPSPSLFSAAFHFLLAKGQVCQYHHCCLACLPAKTCRRKKLAPPWHLCIFLSKNSAARSNGCA